METKNASERFSTCWRSKTGDCNTMLRPLTSKLWMDVTTEPDVRAKALHLSPPNIQNKGFSDVPAQMHGSRSLLFLNWRIQSENISHSFCFHQKTEFWTRGSGRKEIDEDFKINTGTLKMSPSSDTFLPLFPVWNPAFFCREPSVWNDFCRLDEAGKEETV